MTDPKFVQDLSKAPFEVFDSEEEARVWNEEQDALDAVALRIVKEQDRQDRERAGFHS